LEEPKKENEVEEKPSGYFQVRIKDEEAYIPVYGELSKGEWTGDDIDESFCSNPFEI